MFSALRQGSIIHILDKRDNKLKYRTAAVESVSAPRAKANPYSSPYGGTPNMVVDIVIRDVDGTQDFRDIPATLTYAEFENSGIAISETREPLINNVTGLLNNSEQIVNNIEFYKNNIVQCKKVLKELNPEFAKSEQQNEKIESLAKEVNEIKNGFNGIQGDIKQLLSLIKPGNS